MRQRGATRYSTDVSFSLFCNIGADARNGNKNTIWRTNLNFYIYHSLSNSDEIELQPLKYYISIYEVRVDVAPTEYRF
jgi:hypothetical protein